MQLSMLLEMAAEGAGDRVAVGSRKGGRTYAELLIGARRTAAWLAQLPGDRLAVLDRNSEALPQLLFGAAMAGRPFVPLNYRLGPDQLQDICGRLGTATLVTAEDMALPRGFAPAVTDITRAAYLAELGAHGDEPAPPIEPESIAVLLFTSGTTGTPKAAVLRHHHLVSYIIDTVEFLGAGEDEAALVSVPPYHVAGISAILSSVYAGRRMVQMEAFHPEQWVELVREESVTHAMVVPTMLGRVLDVLERDGCGLPSLRHLAYGGGRMPLPTIERALALLPLVDFVNAYGLTETASTIAVLGPDDHREAFASADPLLRRRMASVGRPLPSLEVQIRDPSGTPLPAGQVGEVCVRGAQVAGEYLEYRATSDDGWFATKDQGWQDEMGYLFVEGRLDDVIVRGGENLSPGEIEATLIEHPSVAEVGVVGLPDPEWGEQVAAAVVLEDGATAEESELKEWVSGRLRSSRTPASIVFVEELPYNETGKLLRRVLKTQLAPPTT